MGNQRIPTVKRSFLAAVDFARENDLALAATYPFGFATTGGIISTTGVSGLTLGGGIGYLDRGAGLFCDNLISADVVTADGRFLVANDHENEDLFWALRGGGGNFDAAADLPRFYREFIADAPEQFGGFPAFQIAPPLPFIPENRHGEPLALFVTCWSGPVEEGEPALKPLREVAPVVAELVGPMPYPAVNSTVHIYPINGACHRVGSDETAFASRDANFATVIAGMWPGPAENDRTSSAPLDVKKRYDPDNLFHLNQNIKP